MNFKKNWYWFLILAVGIALILFKDKIFGLFKTKASSPGLTTADLGLAEGETMQRRFIVWSLMEKAGKHTFFPVTGGIIQQTGSGSMLVKSYWSRDKGQYVSPAYNLIFGVTSNSPIVYNGQQATTWRFRAGEDDFAMALNPDMANAARVIDDSPGAGDYYIRRPAINIYDLTGEFLNTARQWDRKSLHIEYLGDWAKV